MREYSAPSDRNGPGLRDPQSHEEVGQQHLSETYQRTHRERKPLPGLTNTILGLLRILVGGEETSSENCGCCQPWVKQGHLALVGRDIEPLLLQSVCKPRCEELTSVNADETSKRKTQHRASKSCERRFLRVHLTKSFPVPQWRWIRTYVRTILCITSRLIYTVHRPIVWKTVYLS